MAKPEGAPKGAYYDPRAYTRNMLKMMDYVRTQVGEEVELLHDVHERFSPIDTVQFAKDVEHIKLFFLEDSLAPEDIEWFRMIRKLCATPIAMGELFNNPHEWRLLIEERLIDFIRMHISQMGGLTPARNAAIHARSTASAPPGTVRAILRRSVTPPTCTLTCGRLILASRNGAASISWFMICSQACRRCETATCIPTTNPAWALTSTKSWRPGIPAWTRSTDGRKPAFLMAALPGHNLNKRLNFPDNSARAFQWLGATVDSRPLKTNAKANKPNSVFHGLRTCGIGVKPGKE